MAIKIDKYRIGGVVYKGKNAEKMRKYYKKHPKAKKRDNTNPKTGKPITKPGSNIKKKPVPLLKRKLIGPVKPKTTKKTAKKKTIKKRTLKIDTSFKNSNVNKRLVKPIKKTANKVKRKLRSFGADIYRYFH